MPQSPAEETAERSAETMPGLAAAAAAVGLENHRRMLHQHAKRTTEGHKAQMGALGIDVGDEDSDEMGNIVITGDITSLNPQSVIDSLNGKIPQQQQQPSVPVPNGSNFAKTAAAIGLAAVGLAAPIAAWNLTRPIPQIVQPVEPPSMIDTLNDVQPGFGKPEWVGE